MTTITTPCVVPDMDEATYHADPVEGGSLSSTGARAILRSPAHYAWEREHRVHKATYDTGTAVHTKVLKKGWPVVALDFDSWRTKAAQEAQAQARADGKVPLLRKDYDVVEAMAESVLAHRPARKILEREGMVEASLFAADPTTGVVMRARPDHTTDDDMTDLKTAVSAAPDVFARDAATYGYDVQSEWYQHVRRIALGADRVPFRFIVVEKSAPYMTAVHELDAEYAQIGRARMHRALEIYKRCSEKGEWPGYESLLPDGEDAHLLAAPRWLAYEEGLGF